MKSPNSRLPTPYVSAHREARYIYIISTDYGGTGRKFCYAALAMALPYLGKRD